MSWSTAWPSLDLQQSRDSLLDLRSLVQGGLEKDATILTQLCRFLTIRSTGHIEFTFDRCLEHYASSKSHPFVAGYVGSTLFKGRSVKPGILVERMGDLNSVWADELNAILNEDDERLRRELAFMVEKRNRIAHGQNHGIGLRKALDLCDVAIAIGDWIVERMDPRDSTP